MNTLRFRLSLLVLSAVSAFHARQAAGQERFIDQVPGIKADSVAVLGYYFKWPSAAIAGDTFEIGILGEAPFTPARVTQEVKTIRGKRIVVREFASAKDYRPCHILFVADQAAPNSEEKSAAERLGAVLPKTENTAVLVVTETDGLSQQGALLNFVVDLVANRVIMEVNRDEARRRRIGLTPGLVQLANTKKVKFITDPN